MNVFGRAAGEVAISVGALVPILRTPEPSPLINPIAKNMQPSPSDSSKQAYVTLVTTDSYVVGAQVLAKSLRNSGTSRQIICLVTPNLSETSLRALSDKQCFDQVRQVEPIDSCDKERLALLGRPELGCTFTKIQVWKQTDLGKVVFMDADMLALSNLDELFGREEFSAAPDVGWPDCFNSGLFVCRPNQSTYNDLYQMATSIGSFDGGDQGLLNQYFSDWSKGDASRRLPFGYNLTFCSSYSYLPAFKHFRHTIKAIHFIGSNKPWSFHRFSDGRVCPRGDYTGDHLEFVQSWWSVHDSLKESKSSSSKKVSFAPSEHQYGFSSDRRIQSAPISPSSFGRDEPNFANYKISWSTDIDAHFSRISVHDPVGSPNADDHYTAPKIAYKSNSAAASRPNSP